MKLNKKVIKVIYLKVSLLLVANNSVIVLYCNKLEWAWLVGGGICCLKNLSGVFLSKIYLFLGNTPNLFVEESTLTDVLNS